jgi:hypothetical protein
VRETGRVRRRCLFLDLNDPPLGWRANRASLAATPAGDDHATPSRARPTTEQRAQLVGRHVVERHPRAVLALTCAVRECQHQTKGGRGVVARYTAWQLPQTPAGAARAATSSGPPMDLRMLMLAVTQVRYREQRSCVHPRNATKKLLVIHCAC